MLIGPLFAFLAVACGLGVTRGLRVPLSLAPMSGLAAILAATGVALAWTGLYGVREDWME